MKTDLPLACLIVGLAVANIWFLLQKKPIKKKCSKDHVIHEEHKREARPSIRCPSQAPSIPAKCMSRLQPLDTRKGMVAGQPHSNKVFLSIGIPSWQGRTDELRTTLTSLFNHVTPEDEAFLLVAVSTGEKHRPQVLQLLTNEFSPYMDKGLLQVVSPTNEFLDAIAKPASLGRRNFGKGGVSDKFVSEVQEFNKHYIFLLEYCQRLSEVYLQLSDEARTLKRFLPTIQNESPILSRDRRQNSLQLSGKEKFTSPGRLLLSSTVKEIAEYGLTFGPNILPNEILDGYRALRVSRGSIAESKEWLFATGEKITADRPPAQIESNLGLVGGGLDIMYNGEKGFAWFGAPQIGQHLKIIFEEEVLLKRIRLVTGSQFFGDYAVGIDINVCPRAQDNSVGNCDETKCKKLGSFGDPVQDITGLESSLEAPTKCIKLDVIIKGERWLLIRDVAVWVKEKRK